MRKIVMIIVGVAFISYMLFWVWWFFVCGNNVSMVFASLGHMGGAKMVNPKTEEVITFGDLMGNATAPKEQKIGDVEFDTEDATGLGKGGAIVAKGGGLVDFLFFLLLLTGFYIVERYVVHFQARGRMSVPKFMEELIPLVKSGKTDEAIKLCDSQKGTYGRYVKAGLTSYKFIPEVTKNDAGKVKEELGEVFGEANAIEAFQLEKRLIFIAMIASIATMTGLLGTVVGMIRSFSALSAKGRPDPNQLATGISEALINTAGGLTVAIISIIFYNYFVNKVDSFNFNMEEFSSEVINTLTIK